MAGADATKTMTAAHGSADTVLPLEVIAASKLAGVAETQEMVKTQPKALDCN